MEVSRLCFGAMGLNSAFGQFDENVRVAVFAAEEILNGQSSRSGMGTSPATVSSRLFMIEFARANTSGLTATQKQQMGFVKDALGVLQPRLNNLLQTEFPAFRQSLLKAC